ncbi:MAG: hypothetical protein Q8764_01690 [Pigeon pea little leaf phytoplasma]|uniref:Sequence-variable mosaic (SVM) signal sequence domain-containing protein n=1 Tax=Candidatus Phytoplasma fabacearum TaxID=2982628 RepID=A0ABU8ZSS1_9MOLU|nr:hypothetical protein ['Bituminaria bituminosa' little leaf phytoplasma]MDV3148624.1 hypothetical protein [Pigeon pea little leaf phytoplasma]MDV3197742.1 hypothetical protein [Candidatus Phytoplasma australasiaticum]MDO7983696.1 hypothetical protein ['Bituminaria bituminosa' little leaf phytoplasma]MDO8023968.1 hypothetical protein ['Bituminaria bituminosa' little leaf phytoplasma]MDO8030723.1 hypothetical protein ['Bituminaria bituminosa' little leaf phytoplasma]
MLKQIQLKLIIFFLLNLLIVNFYGLCINKQGNLSHSKLSNVKAAFFGIDWSFFSQAKAKKTKYQEVITEQSIQAKISEYGKHIENLINISNKDVYNPDTSDLLMIRIKFQSIQENMKEFENKKAKCILTKDGYVTNLNIINVDLNNLQARIAKIQFKENSNNPENSNNQRKVFVINSRNK